MKALYRSIDLRTRSLIILAAGMVPMKEGDVWKVSGYFVQPQ